MPARDIYHQTVRNALEKDGWIITNDPLTIRIGKKDMYIDLGAEKLIAAEKGESKIAVEIKSFVSRSEMNDLENAIGQFIVYHDALAIREPERVLFLAVTHKIYLDIFEEPLGKLLLKNQRVKLLIFEPKKEEVIEWIK